MDYKELISTVQRHVKALGCVCEVEAGGHITDNAISKAESRMKIRFPVELRQFYLEVGDGLSLRWKGDSDDPKAPFANLSVPSLANLASTYLSWQQISLYTPAKAKKYGFPHTKDPALAMQTAAKMWHWMPVIEEGNGDMISFDLSDPSCPVIFDQHDWFDGGSGDNGHQLSTGWQEFLTGWGSVCFQFPKSLYWPTCFRPGQGVAWDSNGFCEPFRIKELTPPS